MFLPARNLVVALAQFWFDERQAERGVYLFLASPRDLAAAMQARGIKAEAFARSQRLELFNVRSRSGCMQ
jgi:hypothetical protein